MSLDHELMVERLSSSSKPNEKTSKSEDELAKWQQQKQELMMQQNRDYMEALFKENSSRPIKINSVQVNNSHLFRESFILKQIEPLMQTNITTLEKFFDKLDVVSQNFKNSNGVENMYISLQESYPNRNTSNGFNSGSFFGRGGVSSSSSSALILSPLIHLVPVKRFYAKTGTNVGNGEGDGYIQFQLKNLFGGSESLIFDAITGTKTQSSYLLNYVQPIFNNSNYIFEQLFYTNTKSLDWLRSDSKVKGTTTKIFTQYLRLSINHDISLENCWRILSNNQSKSIDVLSQLGNDFKLSLLYNWKYDTRDNIHLPSKGSMFRLGLEYSGLFSSLCPSKYFKTVVELQKYSN